MAALIQALAFYSDIFRRTAALSCGLEVITLTQELLMPNKLSLDDETLWRTWESRDTSMVGRFVIAVGSTGIYCRPGCPAKMPKRENVRFFADCDEAEAAGFRACKRCKPNDLSGRMPS